MFIDKVHLLLAAGKGGSGVVAWRREKYVPKGGPFGGDGGDGGDIVFLVDAHKLSLDDFRNIRILKAEDGHNGGSANKKGRNGTPLVLKIPPGTVLKNSKTQEILFDFTTVGEEKIICKGGKGGKGNSAFKSSTNRAPSTCTNGEAGEQIEVELELKIIADVGLVGMPNAGKSTLFSKLTRANAKIAAYPFTTLHPNVSMIEFADFSRLTLADIPGIIENAHAGRGLGLEFLRHIERTSLLLFVIDLSVTDPLKDFQMLKSELQNYKEDLLGKPFLIALNKSDLVGEKEIATFINACSVDPRLIFSISAEEGKGLENLINALSKKMARTGIEPASA